MTMSLHHPSLTLTGKKRGKQKFRNAAEAQRARELEAGWQDLQKKWGVEAEAKKRQRALTAAPLSYSLSAPPGRETRHIPSRGDGLGSATVAETKVYTGDKMLGIGQLHKSNAVPVFRSEDAEDIARMRR